jgi:hypothetical protein
MPHVLRWNVRIVHITHICAVLYTPLEGSERFIGHKPSLIALDVVVVLSREGQ